MTLVTKEKPTILPETPKGKIEWNSKIIYGKKYFVLHLTTSQIWEGYASCVSEAIELADQEKGKHTGERWTSENCFAHYICEEIEYGDTIK